MFGFIKLEKEKEMKQGQSEQIMYKHGNSVGCCFSFGWIIIILFLAQGIKFLKRIF